jgi:hypothetical protein
VELNGLQNTVRAGDRTGIAKCRVKSANGTA